MPEATVMGDAFPVAIFPPILGAPDPQRMSFVGVAITDEVERECRGIDRQEHPTANSLGPLSWVFLPSSGPDVAGIALKSLLPTFSSSSCSGGKGAGARLRRFDLGSKMRRRTRCREKRLP